jgi:periplasmic nitrate reductase NapD
MHCHSAPALQFGACEASLVMSILGVIVRSRPEAVASIEARLRACPGVDVADLAAAADGRLVIVIEDTDRSTAAATLGAIALWPDVLNTALVYEYSGPDSPAPDDTVDYRDWRRGLVADAASASRS